MRDYLYRKTRDSRTRTGEMKKGVPTEITARVFDRLVGKNYIDDEKFARYWVENRNLQKGMSKRKLTAELRAKGVETGIIERLLADSSRSDADELEKIIAKKRRRYPDEQKLMQYLARQGFSYEDIKQALSDD
jgi:regulatory protein